MRSLILAALLFAPIAHALELPHKQVVTLIITVDTPQRVNTYCHQHIKTPRTIHGCMFGGDDVASIVVPNIVTLRDLQTWGHELGHVIYGHGHEWMPDQ